MDETRLNFLQAVLEREQRRLDDRRRRLEESGELVVFAPIDRMARAINSGVNPHQAFARFLRANERKREVIVPDWQRNGF